ncbi:hypothetical protein DMN91_008753 [Ooceraea biroi]|uniref:Histone-lysine N-methyltransferase SETMAR n=1 Tax=Ooceraea biroi TaxID=2015173 RepID=A0A3L8DDM2_OOCBI|nr:hypothetical protein DMN91_008753 [Ooceraea biroi]
MKENFDLQLFQRNPQDFRRRFVTVDETWIHHYTLDTKEQSKQWVASGEFAAAPKKAKTVPSVGKVTATVFWGSQGIILIDYMEKAHFSGVVAAKVMELRFQLVPHPPYSPDLAPSDYYFFPNMKKWLAGRKFYSNEEVIAKTNAYFAELDLSYYSEGINKLEQRWTKCISLKGDYVEK